MVRGAWPWNDHAPRGSGVRRGLRVFGQISWFGVFPIRAGVSKTPNVLEEFPARVSGLGRFKECLKVLKAFKMLKVLKVLKVQGI